MWLSQEALRSQESPDPKETLFHSLRTSWHVDRENLTPFLSSFFFEKYIFLNKSRKCRNAVFKASKVKNFDQLLRLKKLVFIMNAFEESLFKVALFKKKPKRSFRGQTTVGKISHFSDKKKMCSQLRFNIWGSNLSKGKISYCAKDFFRALDVGNLLWLLPHKVVVSFNQ